MNVTAATSKRTRFLFIHGDKDEKVPYADVARFVRRLNEAGNGARAELLTIEDMGHLPDAKTDYRTIADAVERYLGRR
jgi:dipeptidyl aminopeptidase/acylaminoacyl peptidase